MHFLLIILIVIVVLGAAIIYTQCHSSLNEPEIKAATLQGGISTLDLLDKTSIPENNGFKLDVLRLQKTPDILTAIIRGDADVAVIPAEMAGRLLEDNNDIVIIDAEMLQNQAIIMRNIKNIKELAGGKVGALLASGTYKVYKAYMKILYNITIIENGSPKDDEVLAVNVLPGVFLQALYHGDIDAVVVWEPFVSKAIASHNITGVIDFQSLWEKTGFKGEPVMLVWVANKKFVETHPELINAFIKARRQAVSYWRDHPDKTKKILMNLYKLDSKEADILYNRVVLCKENLTSYIEGIRSVWKLAWIGGYLEKDPSIIGGEVFWKAGN